MDFAIVTDGMTSSLTFGKADTIINNVFLSLSVVQGSWFANPQFGMRKRERMKNTEQNARLVAEDAKAALKWLVDTGRATAVEVSAQRDRTQDVSRLKLLVEVTQADGRSVTFEKFVEVV
jgi:phage gp46-like protein